MLTLALHVRETNVATWALLQTVFPLMHNCALRGILSSVNRFRQINTDNFTLCLLQTTTRRFSKVKQMSQKAEHRQFLVKIFKKVSCVCNEGKGCIFFYCRKT